MDNRGDPRCQWCDGSFEPRSDGGKAQRFCRPACRRALDAAGRRLITAALASGTLTIVGLKDGSAATRALLAGAISAVPIPEAEETTLVAPAESPDDDTAALLDDLLIALLELPGDAWSDIAVALPDELYDRIDYYVEARLS